MEKIYLITFIALSVCFVQISFGQEAKSISSSLGLYVFPSNDQTTKQQDADEIAFYKWAIEQTGVDPINPPQIEAAPLDKSPDGSAVRGAARGAAAGATTGAIAGDAGEGAAIGAVVRGLRGRRARVDNVEQQQTEAQAEAREKGLMNNFKKAYSACMEGKGYTVK